MPLSTQAETAIQTLLSKSQLGDDVSFYKPDKKRAKSTKIQIKEQGGHTKHTILEEGVNDNLIFPI